MLKNTWTIAELNLKNIKIPMLVTAIVAASLLIQTLIQILIVISTGKPMADLIISFGCYLWFLPLLAAIFIPARNFRRIVNLGGKREGFFWGSAAAYAELSCVVSLLNTVVYYTFDRFIAEKGYFAGSISLVDLLDLDELSGGVSSAIEGYIIEVGGTTNVVDIFGWTAHGPVFVFFQQFAFLLLVMAAVHTFTAVQGKWYGWTADAVIAAILAVFIPIEPLRMVLLRFFDLIIFNTNAYLQIASCLILAGVIYALNRAVFARKAI